MIFVAGYYGGIYDCTQLLEVFKKHNGKKAYSIMPEHLQRGISDLEMDDAAATPEETYPAEDAGKEENL